MDEAGSVERVDDRGRHLEERRPRAPRRDHLVEGDAVDELHHEDVGGRGSSDPQGEDRGGGDTRFVESDPEGRRAGGAAGREPQAQQSAPRAAAAAELEGDVDAVRVHARDPARLRPRSGRASPLVREERAGVLDRGASAGAERSRRRVPLDADGAHSFARASMRLLFMT